MSEFWAVGGELVDAAVPPSESGLFASPEPLPAGPPGPLDGDEGKPPEESISSIAANGSTSAADAPAGDASLETAAEDARTKSRTIERLDSTVVAVSTAKSEQRRSAEHRNSVFPPEALAREHGTVGTATHALETDVFGRKAAGSKTIESQNCMVPIILID